MAITTTRYAMDLATLVAFTSCVSGCVSALSPPGPDKQADALHSTQFSPATRYAVGARNSNTHKQASYPLGDVVSGEIADVVANKLGINAVALSNSSGSDWSNELVRANDATGWIRASTSEEYFRDADFDGYVLITLNEDIEYYDGPKGRNNDRKFRTFNPFYHVFALPRNRKKILLMQAGQVGRFSCETDGDRLENEAACVDTFVKRFRRELEIRLDRTKLN